jgi:DNA-binding PadR family transcriptional regulator
MSQNAGRSADDLVPLTPAIFHIMLALADGERHGYGIMLEVDRLTNGLIRLGPGTLYRSIQRMLVEGLISELKNHGEDSSDDERRRYYCLTDFGRRVACAESERLAVLVRAAREKRFLSGQ